MDAPICTVIIFYLLRIWLEITISPRYKTVIFVRSYCFNVDSFRQRPSNFYQGVAEIHEFSKALRRLPLMSPGAYLLTFARLRSYSFNANSLWMVPNGASHL